MSDLHAREREDPTWGRAVADLIEDGEVVGMAYEDEDEGEVLLEFYPDADGEPRLYNLADLQRVLETIAAMFGAAGEPLELEAAAGPEEHAVDTLAAEFDPRAARRGPEDEGFYPLEVAVAIIQRCGDLGLAVINLEGFRLVAGHEEPVGGCKADLASAYRGEPWSVFLAGCNLQALAALERWPRRPGFGVTLEVQDAAGEVYVL